MESGLKSVNIIGLILAITIVPLVMLMWLGWRLLDQDRQLEEQQIQERVEHAADLIVAEIEQAISNSERQLSSGNEEWADGALGIVFEANGARVYPRERTAFVPVPESLVEAPSASFAEGERLEFQLNDLTGAVELFRAIARSDDPAERAGALLRLGRNLTKLGRTEEALAVYAELSGMDGVLADGTPAGLAGRFARLQILEAEHREEQLKAEAAQLSAELRGARWPLTEAVYRLYLNDAEGWRDIEGHIRTEGELFGEALDYVWAQRDEVTTSYRESITVDEDSLTVLWEASGGDTRALIVTQRFVETQWLETPIRVAHAQGVSLALRNSEGRTLFGKVPENDLPTTDRLAQVTELPWTLSTTSLLLPGNDPAFARRRQLLMAGFVLVVAMALTATYLMFRGVKRERALASMQSEFVGTVSHEFRTPLTALRQFTEMLGEDRRLDDDRRRICYEALGGATDRLEKLVETLLDFGRMEAGARTYQRESLDCTTQARKAVENFRIEAQAAGHVVRFEGNGAAMVEGDAEALAHALHNLLDNAVKYSPDRPDIRVYVRSDGDQAKISIQDDGIGIPAEEQEAIFEKFKRGDQARARGIRGTGIGLAMVDDIVRGHDGRLEIESEVGQGSTFTIVLPLKDTRA